MRDGRRKTEDGRVGLAKASIFAQSYDGTGRRDCEGRAKERIFFSLALIAGAGEDSGRMKNYTKVLFSFLAAVVCVTAFAADKPTCKKSGKNCPMNDGKECNCGKDCSC
jgi:hypothetical protein